MIFCKTCTHRRWGGGCDNPVFPKYVGALEIEYQSYHTLNKNNDCKHFKEQTFLRKLRRIFWS